MFDAFLVQRYVIWDHVNLSSSNISSQWHVIQCICIVKINTQKIGKILKVEINLSLFDIDVSGSIRVRYEQLGLKI